MDAFYSMGEKKPRLVLANDTPTHKDFILRELDDACNTERMDSNENKAKAKPSSRLDKFRKTLPAAEKRQDILGEYVNYSTYYIFTALNAKCKRL